MSRVMATVSALLLLFAGYCSGYTKLWLPNTNYDNPQNWNVGRVPCPNDNIRLTSIQDESVSVFLQSNTTIKEMTLPGNGVITLSSNMILSFSDKNTDKSCNGEDVEFTRGASKDWFNPFNWNATDDTVLVETENIPCQYDNVIFPEGGKYYIQLDADVTINSLRFSGMDFTSTSFASFLQNEGSDQFNFGNLATPPNVNIVSNVCSDVTGCPCGNDDQQTKDKICNSFQCFSLMCKDPIEPVGGCCPTCGAMLTLKYNKDKFNLEMLKKTIRDRYGDQADYSEVSVSASKTRENKIQIVCIDKSAGQTAIAMATDLDQFIIDNMNDLGFTNVTMQISGKATRHLIDDAKISGGAVVGIIIALLIALAVCTVITLLYRKGWCTRQEKLLCSDVELKINKAEFINHPTEPTATLTAFDNPMYDTTPIDSPDFQTKYNPMFSPPEVFSEDDGTLRGFTNPVNIETSFEISLDDEEDDDKKMIITPDNNDNETNA